jgi:hypothetical protein
MTLDTAPAHTAPPQDSSLRHRESRWQGFVVLAIVFALAGRLFLLISRYAVNIFFMDQWDFNEATLFQKHSLWEMFRWQHGPHRQGLGAIVAYWVEPFFGWSAGTESFLIGGVVLLATVCALWLKRRLFGPLSIFDACIPLILLSPLQYETLVITANFAHGPLPLLLVLLYCLTWTVNRTAVRYLLVLLINFAAIHTGFGMFLGVITPVALAGDYWLRLRRIPRGAVLFAVCLAVSLASLGFFFVHYRLDTAVDCAPNLFQSPASYAQFLLLIFANLFGAKGTGLFPVLVGALVLAAMLTALVMSAIALREPKDRPKYWTAAILLGFCLLFAANAAYGRSCLGTQVAQVSRYIIYMECGLLGLYFFLVTLSRPVLRGALLLVLTAALIGTIPLRADDKRILQFVSAAKSSWKACYLEHEDIRGCNHAVGYGVYPNLDHDLKGKLEFLKQNRLNLYSGE